MIKPDDCPRLSLTGKIAAIAALAVHWCPDAATIHTPLRRKVFQGFAPVTGPDHNATHAT